MLTDRILPSIMVVECRPFREEAMLKWIGVSGLAIIAAMGAVSGARADTLIDFTTFYQFGCPAGASGYCGSPDTSFVTITNEATSTDTFTGTISDFALAANGTDYSLVFNGVTLAPGQSFTFGTSPESSNVGGFGGPTGTVQPGIFIDVSGAFNGPGGNFATSLSAFDSTIHSGVVRDGGCGPTDAYVLQGGCPTGFDTGDGFETTQANGFKQFDLPDLNRGVPGPIAGAGLPGLIFASGGLLGWWRRRKNEGTVALASA
jgi:hypothetical protein